MKVLRVDVNTKGVNKDKKEDGGFSLNAFCHQEVSQGNMQEPDKKSKKKGQMINMENQQRMVNWQRKCFEEGILMASNSAER